MARRRNRPRSESDKSTADQGTASGADRKKTRSRRNRSAATEPNGKAPASAPKGDSARSSRGASADPSKKSTSSSRRRRRPKSERRGPKPPAQNAAIQEPKTLDPQVPPEATIEVIFDGKVVHCAVGTQANLLLEKYPSDETNPVLGFTVNGRLRRLNHRLVSNCRVTSVPFGTLDGTSIYIRTVTLLLCEAVHDIDPGMNPVVGQSLAGGYSFTLRRNGKLLDKIDPGLIRRFRRRMRTIVSEDRPVEVRRVTVEEALEYFRRINAPDKVKLLETTRRAEIQMATVGKYRDLVTGPLALSAGVIEKFDLVPYESEMVLRFPAPDFNLRPRPRPQRRLYNSYRETRRWNEELGVGNIGQLNEAVIHGHVSEIIHVAEGFHEKKIAAIADEIAERKNNRLVLVAGPSSSGKTTFTKRLSVQLRVLGLRPVAISMDNYYVNRVDTPKHSDGSYNFESLDALDVKLFNDHVHRLIRGEHVETPIYSFVTGTRVEKTIPMQLGPHDILITEGIHCLNPRLTEGIPPRRKFGIYVSALTQLSMDDHSRIFTADVRLLRRIVRDRIYRNYTAEQTLKGWGSVRRGENRYIFPFQENADSMFNSALVYEPAVIRTYAERFLLEVPLESETMSEAYRLLRFLHMLVPLFPEEVPQNSLLREFIGGSAFRY